MDILNNFDKTDNVYSLAPTDDWLDSEGLRLRSQQAIEVKSCEHHSLWTTWAISMKLTVNNHSPLLMTWLEFGGQRSRSQQIISIWWRKHSRRRWGVKVNLLVVCWYFGFITFHLEIDSHWHLSVSASAVRFRKT